MTGYDLANIFGVLLIITSVLVLLAKSPKSGAIVYSAQSLILVGVFLALASSTGSAELTTWAGTAFILKVIVVPALMLYAYKKMDGASAGLEPKIKVAKLLPIVAIEVFVCFALVQGIQLPTAQAAMPLLAISAAHFFIGLTCIASQRNIIKQVFGYCLMENGAHLTLAILAPTAPKLVEIGITTDAFFAVIIMLVVVYQIYKVTGSLDADNLTELKG